jgi:hypothetical protein
MISRFLMEDIRIPKMKVILSKRIKKQIADMIIRNFTQVLWSLSFISVCCPPLNTFNSQ